MAEGKSTPTGFLLLLGILIGFVIGFVILLSNLPVDRSISSFNEADVEPVALRDMNYDYYSILPQQRAASRPLETRAPAEQRRRATDVSATNKAAEIRTLQRSSREIPATNKAKQTYYLQAGNYQRAADAERARIDLLRLGLDATIVMRQDQRGNYTHRVRVGPFVDQAGLSAARSRLQDGGVPFQIIRVTG